MFILHVYSYLYSCLSRVQQKGRLHAQVLRLVELGRLSYGTVLCESSVGKADAASAVRAWHGSLQILVGP